MSHLTRPIMNCPCGKPHICPIQAVEIGDGVLTRLPTICGDYQHILLVADRNTYNACGREVDGILGSRVQARHIFAEEGVVIPDETAVAAIEGKLTDTTDLVVGVGSGVINDLCKYVSHRRDYRHRPLHGRLRIRRRGYDPGRHEGYPLLPAPHGHRG